MPESKNIHKCEYLLPDFLTRHRGAIYTPDIERAENAQKITLSVERFAIPEILFRPSDMGLNQIGIVEALLQSFSAIPEGLM